MFIRDEIVIPVEVEVRCIMEVEDGRLYHIEKGIAAEQIGAMLIYPVSMCLAN